MPGRGLFSVPAGNVLSQAWAQSVELPVSLKKLRPDKLSGKGYTVLAQTVLGVLLILRFVTVESPAQPLGWVWWQQRAHRNSCPVEVVDKVRLPRG